MVPLGILTGMRVGEILGLRRKDVDFLSGQIKNEQANYRGIFGTPKTKGSKRSLPISQRPRRTARARMWTPCPVRRRAPSISISPWQPAQRFESPAPAFETRWTEDRNTLAQLAHAQAHRRYFVAGGRSVFERCASTTRSQQDVHNARALHGADSRALAGSSRKPCAIGDEW
jgi:integrase